MLFLAAFSVILGGLYYGFMYYSQDTERLNKHEAVGVLPGGRICHVQQFGAVGDGVHDDTQSVERAVKVCSTVIFSRVVSPIVVRFV